MSVMLATVRLEAAITQDAVSLVLVSRSARTGRGPIVRASFCTADWLAVRGSLTRTHYVAQRPFIRKNGFSMYAYESHAARKLQPKPRASTCGLESIPMKRKIGQ